MNKKKFSVSQLVLLSLLTAILLLMAYTPLGYLNVGPLAITFNVIPVAVAAIALGPTGGAIVGAIFGFTSFGQCIGLGGLSAMGSMLFSINPVFTFIQCFVPRILDGYLIGWIYRITSKFSSTYTASAITGFFSAALNTVFYMSCLVFLFGNTDYLQGLIGGRNIILWMCLFVGINAVCEMISSTIITGVVGAALGKAKLVPQGKAKAKPEVSATQEAGPGAEETETAEQDSDS